MTRNDDKTTELCSQVSQAYKNKSALYIVAGNSKAFYGQKVDGAELSVSDHCGIIDYRPSELVLTARSGTKLSVIETELAKNNQMLAYEPPRHSAASTIGGNIACGLSGPRRPYVGAARDFVLGTTIINGKGELLRFGGQVMKNVAGYDASRLMVGAQGTLGVITEISIKVLPKPETEQTLSFEETFENAHSRLRSWILKGHPVSASCYYNNQLFLRLSSTENSVNHAKKVIGGDSSEGGIKNRIWETLQHQTHEFFSNHDDDSASLWRISVPPSSPAFAMDCPQLTEWNGGLRWIYSNDDMQIIANTQNGHATHYGLNNAAEKKQSKKTFQQLPAELFSLHQRIKKSFDPENILNPGRLYEDL